MVDDYMSGRRSQRARRRFEAKILVEALKDGPCADCGNRFEPCQMDLVRKGEGRPVSSLLLKSKDRIREAAAACDLVCANCGRLRDEARRKRERAGPV